MENFWSCVWGFILFVAGVVFLVRTKKMKKKDFVDTYGNYISIYSGEIGLIIIGLFLFIKGLSNLL